MSIVISYDGNLSSGCKIRSIVTLEKKKLSTDVIPPIRPPITVVLNYTINVGLNVDKKPKYVIALLVKTVNAHPMTRTYIIRFYVTKWRLLDTFTEKYNSISS